jgi:LDH2 family malate/lactate/ureidoglycolate dehydrogenase
MATGRNGYVRRGARVGVAQYKVEQRAVWGAIQGIGEQAGDWAVVLRLEKAKRNGVGGR